MNIRIDAGKAGISYKPIWRTCVGAGRANEGLRAEWQRQLRETVKDAGFKYIRFHGMLMDDMFVFRVIDGKKVYNWQYLDELIDALLDIGIRPFVEFSFTPADMSTKDTHCFWWRGNSSPPRDYALWGELIEKVTAHWVDRYGLEEVRQWYFECWNEANLNRLFWSGTKSEYFELYKVTALAVKRVDSQLRIGGPASSNFVPDDRFDGEQEDRSRHARYDQSNINLLKWKGVWIEDFLNYCAENKLPVDFVSTHPYPTDFAFDGQSDRCSTRHLNSVVEDLTWLKECMRVSAYPNAEVHLTEWNSSPVSRDYSHDYLPAATYVVKQNLDCIELTDSLVYWCFTDIFEEEGGGPEAFHGGFGLTNAQGVHKPTYHAYRLLNTLRDKLLDKGDAHFATVDDGGFAMLLYNYPEGVDSAPLLSVYPDYSIAESFEKLGSALQCSLTVENLAPDTELTIETLDADHGCIMKLWREMNRPAMLSREQAAQLRAYSAQTQIRKVRTDASGKLELDLKLEPWSIISIRS